MAMILRVVICKTFQFLVIKIFFMMQRFEEANGDNRLQTTSIENQPGPKDDNISSVDRDKNDAISRIPVTNSAEETSAGIEESKSQDEEIIGQSEEDKDEVQNNWKDAVNDDDTLPPSTNN